MNRPLMEMYSGAGNLRQKIERLQARERELRSAEFKLKEGKASVEDVDSARNAVRCAERVLDGAIAEVETDIVNYRAAPRTSEAAGTAVQLEVLS